MPRKPYHDDFRFKVRNGIYYVLYRYEPGRPRSTGQTTETEAIAWAYAHLGESTRSASTLRDFARDFFIPGKCTWATRMLKKGRTFAADYFPGHRYRLEGYVLPRFGSLLVSAITTKMLDEWLMDLRGSRSGEELSAETKHKMLVTLRKVFEEAVYQGVISTNPAKGVSPFYDRNPGREPFTVAELAQLFPDDYDELTGIWLTRSWAAFFYVQASCGLRPGEVAALQWGDWIRSLHGAIIRRSVEHGSQKLKGLKTEKKGVDMKPAVFTSRAEELLLMLEAESERTGLDDLVFSINGRPLILETANKHFKASCVRAGVDPAGRTQYCLRHTFNTLVAKRASLVQLQTAMGHVSMSSSRRYMHPAPEDLLEQAAPVRDVIENVFTWKT